MSVSVSNIAIASTVPFLMGVIAAFGWRAYFFSKMQIKIRNYQSDITKSHTTILELDDENEQLQKRIMELESAFLKDRIIMN